MYLGLFFLLKKLNLSYIPTKIFNFAPMNLAIDVGNTLAKAALFEQNTLKKYIDRLDEQSLQHLLAQEKIEKVIISSVNPYSETLVNLIPSTVGVVKLNYSLPIPIRHLYQTPQTLGMDRVAAVVGATILYPFANRLVIDAGTCITYDFIDKLNVYHGGSISLGLQMRFRALHEFTAKLPLFSKENFIEEMPFIGNSTETSMVSGVINGTLREIEGFINMYAKKFENLQVVFCGGDAAFLTKHTKTEEIKSEHQRDLLFIGLNTILLHNQ
jgi:type III pantothenate kinase